MNPAGLAIAAVCLVISGTLAGRGNASDVAPATCWLIAAILFLILSGTTTA